MKDLKQRGLLDETLVVWGGEFGRTPMNEARSGSKFLGRDHHPRAFTMWLAGGGIKPGITVGQTDDVGYNIAEDPVSVHDLHATILHLHGAGPHEADLSVPGARLPADGRARRTRSQVNPVVRDYGAAGARCNRSSYAPAICSGGSRRRQ